MFIEIDGWMAKMRFSACHFIPEHHKCGCLHGHTYAVSVRIEGEKNGEFIIDFEIIKNIILKICKRLDHKILIAEKDKRLNIRKKDDIIIDVINKKKHYVFPSEDVVFLALDSLSAESLCKYFAENIFHELKSLDYDNIKRICVRVDEGIGQGAGCSMNLR